MNPFTCALDQDIRMHKLRPQCASVHTQAMNAVLALYCKHYWEGEGDRADAVFSKVSLLRTDSTMFSRFQRFTAIPWSAVLRCRQIRKSSHLSRMNLEGRCHARRSFQRKVGDDNSLRYGNGIYFVKEVRKRLSALQASEFVHRTRAG